MSSYETSNGKVNRLWRNIVWSTYGNFLSIPTDCPQRNERMGWMGDISVFSRTATYLADAPQFLRRYLLAVRDLQREDGRFEDIAPIGGGFGGMLWGSGRHRSVGMLRAIRRQGAAGRALSGDETVCRLPA